MTDSPRGITTLAALLGQLASGEPVTAGQFAQARNYARSSVFELARRLQAEGLLVRDDNGALLAGPVAYDLAWAALGLPGLRGPAKAVLLWLREHTEHGASLYSGSEELLAVPGPEGKASDHKLCCPILDNSGKERARLVLRCGMRTDRAFASVALRCAAATLEHHLRILP